MIKVAKCLYDYSALEESELSFKESDILLVNWNEHSGEEAGDWLNSRIFHSTDQAGSEIGAEGIAPLNYLEILHGVEMSCLFEYEAQNDTELAVAEGETLLVFCDCDGWSVAAKGESRQEIGFVPTNYLSPQAGNAESGDTSGTQKKKDFSDQELSLFAALAQDGNAGEYVDPLQAYASSAQSAAVVVDDEFVVDEFDSSPVSQKAPFPLPAVVSAGAVKVPAVISPSIVVAVSESSPKQLDMSDPSRRFYHTVATAKVGKKTRDYTGMLSIDSQMIYFLNDKDRSIIQQWKPSAVTDVKREKKVLKVEFESISYSFAFKSKSEAVEVLTILQMNNGGGASVPVGASLGSIASSASDSSLNNNVSPSGSKSNLSSKKLGGSIPNISSPLANSFQHMAHTSPPAGATVAPNSKSPLSSVGGSGGGGKKTAIAIYDYTANDDAEVSIVEGDVVEIVDRSDPDWTKVSNGGVVGFVPSTHIKDIDAPPPKPPRPGGGVSPAASTKSSDPPPKPPRPSSSSKTSPVAVSPVKSSDPPPKPARPQSTISPVVAAAAIVSPVKNGPPLPARTQPAAPIPSVIKPTTTSAAPLSRPEPAVNSTQVEPPISAPVMPARPPVIAMQPTASSRRESEPAPKSPQDSSDKDKPPTDNLRMWTDKSGTFKVEAVLLGIADGKVLLHKSNGVKIGVPLTKLSADDIEFLTKTTGQTFDLPVKPSKRTSVSSQKVKEEPEKTSYRGFDWLEFFKGCSIDNEDALKYAKTFSAEKMDKDTVADLDKDMLKGLGVVHGDILRILKKNGRTSPKEGSTPRVQRAESGLGPLMTEMAPNTSTAASAKGTPFGNSASSLFDNPETKARILLAEQRAAHKNQSFLVKSNSASSKLGSGSSLDKIPPDYSTISGAVDNAASRKAQEFDDEALARRLQDEELRSSGLSKLPESTSRPSQSVSMTAPPPKSQVAPRQSSSQSQKSDGFDWPESFSTSKEPAIRNIPVTSSVLTGSAVSASQSGTLRRGRVAGNTVDASTIFNAAKVVSQSPAITSSSAASPWPEDNKNDNFLALSQQQNPSPAITQPVYRPPVSNTPLIPVTSSITPLPVTISNGNEPVNISSAASGIQNISMGNSGTLPRGRAPTNMGVSSPSAPSFLPNVQQNPVMQNTVMSSPALSLQNPHSNMSIASPAMSSFSNVQQMPGRGSQQDLYGMNQAHSTNTMGKPGSQQNAGGNFQTQPQQYAASPAMSNHSHGSQYPPQQDSFNHAQNVNQSQLNNGGMLPSFQNHPMQSGGYQNQPSMQPPSSMSNFPNMMQPMGMGGFSNMPQMTNMPNMMMPGQSMFPMQQPSTQGMNIQMPGSGQNNNFGNAAPGDKYAVFRNADNVPIAGVFDQNNQQFPVNSNANNPNGGLPQRQSNNNNWR
eukprot:Partr_v1_DN28975_c0_g1_i1_m25994 putative Cytoskeleton assembly control protein